MKINTIDNRQTNEFHIPIKKLKLKNQNANCITNQIIYRRNKENLNTINTQFSHNSFANLINGNLPPPKYSLSRQNYLNLRKERSTTSMPFIKKRAVSFRKIRNNNINFKHNDFYSNITENNVNNKNSTINTLIDSNKTLQLAQRKSKVIIFPKAKNNVNQNVYSDSNSINSVKSVLLNMNINNSNTQNSYKIKSKKIFFSKNNYVNNNELKFEDVKKCLNDKFSTYDENNPNICNMNNISNNYDYYFNNINANEISQEQEKLKIIEEKKKLLLQQEKERKKKFLELLLQEEKNFELNEQKFKLELQQQEKTENEIKQKINKLKHNISNKENSLINISEIFHKDSFITKADNFSEISSITDRFIENTKSDAIRQKLCIPKIINKKIIPYHTQSFSKGNEELLIIDKMNKENGTKNKSLNQKLKHRAKKSNSYNNLNANLPKNKNRKNFDLFIKKLEYIKKKDNGKNNHDKKINNTMKNKTCGNESLKYLISNFKNHKILLTNPTNSHKNKFEEYVNPCYCIKKIKFPDVYKLLQEKKNNNSNNNIKTLSENNLFQCKSSDNIKIKEKK